ncbi:cell division protein FtsA [Sphingomonas sp. ABOLD]|uniref:Cell division protein FtsA n=1 Tax=Sphingomonas trueperi TaxID=53317 RepID=A0A7X5XZG9_9SPHN|nr:MULTISPECIES: cell division protein FtsA [Sphingomonas]NJB97810.1 cell division protein FtsA [Sphingomonas trueperi]RSV52994.1 cell division protein FtsA [Sphingomonas sp. ABOLD]
MAKAAPEGLITALDVGSSKVSALIAQRTDEGNLIVLGTGQRESRGVKRGYVADMHATEIAIREAVEQAERIAGFNIEDVWVSFSAGGLVSSVVKVEADLGGHRVEQADIDDLLKAGRGAIDPQGRMVLHAQPTRYTVDGLGGVKRPLGLHADRLGVDVHVVTTDGSPVRNLDLCVRSAHLEVRSIIAAPVATGLACLTEEERELGVALVEIGAGVTNVSVFAQGVLAGLASIPMGSADITDDIAAAFGTARAWAERTKCFHGSANLSPRDNRETIDVAPATADEGTEGPRITKAALNTVIRQRLERLIAEISKELKKLNFQEPVGRQIVLTGGGAELAGIADYAQQALGNAVRVGRPRGLLAMPNAHAGPAFSTLAGLTQFAAADPIDLRTLEPSRHQLVTRASPGALFQRLIAAFRANY